ncbi:MAG: response regulator transcription factor [Leptolyngbyaceae bacterium]|nr:response regulator transcription factor [Leptolyngbyaceae bacterium]
MKTILLVDDDVTLRIALSHYLETHGYTIIQAETGVEALSLFEQYHPDLIVSDIVMPQMDGLEFCRTLRSQRAGRLTPFIFLSSRSGLEDRVKGHQIGADDYLVKPFEPLELLAKIEAQLERSHRIHTELVQLLQQTQASPQSPEPPPVETPKPLPLSPAEQRVFWQVIQGLTNKQIGDRLFISPRTVQTHLSNILGKLEMENRAQLTRFAFENGYTPPEVEQLEE